MIEGSGSDPEPDPYLWLVDPDPGGQKTSGSGFYSRTLVWSAIKNSCYSTTRALLLHGGPHMHRLKAGTLLYNFQEKNEFCSTSSQSWINMHVILTLFQSESSVWLRGNNLKWRNLTCTSLLPQFQSSLWLGSRVHPLADAEVLKKFV